MKTFVFALLIVSISLGHAQTETTADTVINSGWVIAYGRLLNKPYKLTMLNDTTYVNGIEMEPPHDYYPLQPRTQPMGLINTDTGEIVIPKMHAFHLKLRDLCEKWKKNYNNDSIVKKMLSAYIDTQHLVRIKEYVFYGSGVKITYDYKWKDLYLNLESDERQLDTLYMGIYADLPIDIKSDYEQYQAKHASDFEQFKAKYAMEKENRDKRKQTQRKLMFNMIKGILNQRGLFFVDNWDMMTMSAEVADSVVLAIRKIINTQIPDSLKVIEIQRFVHMPDEGAMEILNNSDSWKEDNDK
ncbi:MAG TPA: hypothetical protein VF399_11440 [bacterium]|jgi:hypothetical protein